MKKNIIKIGIILAIVIIGIAIMAFAHFKFSLYFSKNIRMEIYLGKDFEAVDVAPYIQEILADQRVIVEKAGVFSDTINITTTPELTDEQQEQIINKLNEVYGTELTVDADTYIIYNSNVKGRDIFAPYLVISVVAVIIIIAIIALLYGKSVGYKRVVLTSALITIGGQFLYFVILSLTRVEINRIIPGTSVAIFLASMIYLMAQFEKMKDAK